VILVWGFKTYTRLLGIVTLVCGNCHNPAAQRLVERVRKFTLFWIPLFVVKRQTVMTCAFCGTASALSKEQTASIKAQMSSEPGQDPEPAAVAAELRSEPTGQ
jgi:hypothetical protein